MKLHLGVDAPTGEVVAHVLTDGHADEAAQVAWAHEVADMADGAYDGDPVYQAAAARQPDRPPDVVIPPWASAVLSTADPNKQSPRDRHIQLLAEHGRMAWQRMTAMAGETPPKRLWRDTNT